MITFSSNIEIDNSNDYNTVTSDTVCGQYITSLGLLSANLPFYCSSQSHTACPQICVQLTNLKCGIVS